MTGFFPLSVEITLFTAPTTAPTALTVIRPSRTTVEIPFTMVFTESAPRLRCVKPDIVMMYEAAIVRPDLTVRLVFVGSDDEYQIQAKTLWKKLFIFGMIMRVNNNS